MGIIGGEHYGVLSSAGFGTDADAATVMPHALFLGSSLSSVDRLDMLPVPPAPEPAQKSFAMPSLNIGSRLRSRFRREPRQYQETAVELNLYPRSSSFIREASCSSETTRHSTPETDAYLKPSDVPMEAKKSSFELAQTRYEADIRAFDRIAWVDVHLLHATVCSDTGIRHTTRLIDQ